MLAHACVHSIDALQNYEAAIGETLLSYAEAMKLYTTYCINQDQMYQTIAKYRKDRPAFAKFLQEAEKTPKSKNLDLQSFLIKPTQRICKYPLLLQAILKETPSGHADRGSLENALKKLEAVAGSINEGKRRVENQRKMFQLQTMFGSGVLIDASREIVKEGALVKLSKNKEQERMFFLFSDILVWARAKKANATMSYKGKVPLANIRLFPDVLDDVNFKTCSREFAFQIDREDDVKHRTYYLCAKSEIEKVEWLRALTNTMANLVAKRRFDDEQQPASPSPQADEAPKWNAKPGTFRGGRESQLVQSLQRTVAAQRIQIEQLQTELEKERAEVLALRARLQYENNEF
jgi:FYVE/RhoGEF/PH domain-containing protein 5/6